MPDASRRFRSDLQALGGPGREIWREALTDAGACGYIHMPPRGYSCVGPSSGRSLIHSITSQQRTDQEARDP